MIDDEINKSDLSNLGVQEYWTSVDGNVAEILRNMELAEGWTLDNDNELLSILQSWLQKLDEPALNALIRNQDKLLTITGFLKSGRGLLLLKEIDQRCPGLYESIYKVAINQIENKEGDIRMALVLRERYLALYRLGLLNRVFSSERRELVKNAVSRTTLQYGGLHEEM